MPNCKAVFQRFIFAITLRKTNKIYKVRQFLKKLSNCFIYLKLWTVCVREDKGCVDGEATLKA